MIGFFFVYKKYSYGNLKVKKSCWKNLQKGYFVKIQHLILLVVKKRSSYLQYHFSLYLTSYNGPFIIFYYKVGNPTQDTRRTCVYLAKTMFIIETNQISFRYTLQAQWYSIIGSKGQLPDLLAVTRGKQELTTLPYNKTTT